MSPTSSIRHVRHFLGLGVAGDLSTLCDDNVMWAWTNLHVKVFIGPWIWLMNFQVSRKRKAVTDGTLGKSQEADRKD